MNIVLQCCALAMLVTLFLIFVREKNLDLHSRRLFFFALISCIICVSLDILSIIGINAAAAGNLPPFAAKLICKFYVASLTFQSYEAFLYAAGEFFEARKKRIFRTVYQIWTFGGMVLIFGLPIDYTLNGREVYSYGPATVVTYIVVLVLIVSTILMAFRSNGYSTRQRRWAILLWQGSWLAAALIQLLAPSLLLVGFAAAFGMLIIYAELENPHEGIDRMTGQYTANALQSYVGDLYQHRRTFSSIHILVEYLTENVEMEAGKAAMLGIAEFLNRDRAAYVFRSADDGFVVIYRNRERMEAEYGRIRSGLQNAVSMPVRFRYIVMPDSSILDTADEYFRFHHYCIYEAEEKDELIVNRVTVAGMREYSDIKELIRTALDDGRVEVFYQPFYEVSTGRFSAAEALVRIRDLDGRVILPGVFVPIAEDNGLIIPLGMEIFRQVCVFLATGIPQKLGLNYVEVNLSVAQFERENPTEFAVRIMEENHVDPSLINFEITETANNSAKQVLLKNMNKLIDYGVHFSLDDFGTGRSNLDYFVDMPVSTIKFDYSFTQSYFQSMKAKDLLESMIDLMHKMGLKIVSEGVETLEQMRAMAALGVEFIQGFYFSQPLPQEEFLRFLQENNATSVVKERREHGGLRVSYTEGSAGVYGTGEMAVPGPSLDL